MQFCPRCGCDLSPYLAAETQQPALSGKYDQTKMWKQIIEKVRERRAKASPPTLMELVEPAAKAIGVLASTTKAADTINTIIHIAFDHDIVPAGGVLHRAIMLDGKVGMRPEQLEAMGYEVNSTDSKIMLVNDMPVSRAYVVLDYWGGEKQYRRWHLARPVTIEPSRNGDPYFMDGEMLAFGASWKDDNKVSEALLNLLDMFARGIKGEKGVAFPFALEIARVG